MAEEIIHGVKIEIEDGDVSNESIKKLIHGWKDHASIFNDERHAVKHDPNHKMYIGDRSNIVFEYKGDIYKLRMSNSNKY